MDDLLHTTEEIYQESLHCEGAARFISKFSDVVEAHRDIVEKLSPKALDMIPISRDTVTSLKLASMNLHVLLRMCDIVEAYKRKYGRELYDKMMAVPINYDAAKDYSGPSETE